MYLLYISIYVVERSVICPGRHLQQSEHTFVLQNHAISVTLFGPPLIPV
jgi:hypothetical protein